MDPTLQKRQKPFKLGSCVAEIGLTQGRSPQPRSFRKFGSLEIYRDLARSRYGTLYRNDLALDLQPLMSYRQPVMLCSKVVPYVHRQWQELKHIGVSCMLCAGCLTVPLLHEPPADLQERIACSL